MTCFAYIEIALRWKDDRAIEEDTDEDGNKYHRVKPSLVSDQDDPEDDGWENIWRPNLILDQIVGDEDEGGEVSEMAVCRDPVTSEPMLYMYKIYQVS